MKSCNKIRKLNNKVETILQQRKKETLTLTLEQQEALEKMNKDFKKLMDFWDEIRSNDELTEEERYEIEEIIFEKINEVIKRLCEWDKKYFG